MAGALRLLAITPPTGPVAPSLTRAWLEAGVDRSEFAVLLRGPGCSPRQLLSDDGRLAPLRRACREQGVRALLSCDHAALAEAAALLGDHDLAGLQLRGDPTTKQLARARERLGERLLGRSCHGQPDVTAEARRRPLVDYTCFAPVFTPSTSQPGVEKRAAGLDALRPWTRLGGPLLALGGINRHTAPAVLAAGAHGLAGIGVFFGDPHQVVEDVAALCRALDEANSAELAPPDHAVPPVSPPPLRG